MAIRELKQAALDVLAERQRQIEAEGWHADHDDAHGKGELAMAAACYAMFAAVSDEAREATDLPESLTTHGRSIPGCSAWLEIWPWARSWWKPKDRRRDLVRAGALILAEIERLDRADAVRWKPCPRCTTPNYCTNGLRGCDISESLEAGIDALSSSAAARGVNPSSQDQPKGGA